MTIASVRTLLPKQTATVAGDHARDESLAVARGLKSQKAGLLEELIVRYQHRLLRYLLFLTGNRDTAEDLFQEVWMRVLVRGEQFNGRARFETWLFTIARNKSINALKKKSPVPMNHLPERADSRNPSDELSDKELFNQLDEILKALPGKLQRAFILSEFEQMPYEQIAQIERARLGTLGKFDYRYWPFTSVGRIY